MSKIKLMTDSACDITIEEEKQYGIKVLCFPITVNDNGYFERKDFTPEEFWDVLDKCEKIPATSQITAMQLLEEYKAIEQEGFSDVIYVTINSKGSATYSNACLAKENFFEKYPDKKGKFNIHVVDSKTYTMAYGMAVVEAARKIERGASTAEILAYLDDWFNSVEVYFAPYSLRFAKKSGRISCAAAFVGELMGLKPIISIIDGEMTIVKKVRGEKSIVPTLVAMAQEHAIPATPFTAVYGIAEEDSRLMAEKCEKALSAKCLPIHKVGAAIAINAGPVVLAVIVKGKNRKHD